MSDDPREQAICSLCGEPMPPGEEMFKYHGYTGPCPKPIRASNGPEQRDDDIPPETRRELMHCATSNGRISYWYLCDIWRRGQVSALASSRSREQALRAYAHHKDRCEALIHRDACWHHGGIKDQASCPYCNDVLAQHKCSCGLDEILRATGEAPRAGEEEPS